MAEQPKTRDHTGASWNEITIEHLWLALPFFVIFVKGFLFPLPLLDFWWHLKMGEVIATMHSIPRIDLFSFTAAGKPFIVQNWLAEVIYYKTYQLGGPPLMVFLNTVMLALGLLPIYLLCREATSRVRLAVLAAFLACLVFFGNMRPQVFSLVLFATYYWVLDGYRFRRRDRLWLLPVLMIAWVNLHGAFAVGLGLVALFLVCESARRLICPAREDVLSVPQLRKLALILVCCLAATLLNPETYRIYDYIRVVLSDQASQKFVMEWQPPRINSRQGILLFYGPFYLSLVAMIFTRAKPNLTDLALFLGFSFFGLTAIRNTIWFGIIIGPILARCLAAVELSALLGSYGRALPSDATAKPCNGPKRAPRPLYRLNFALAFVALYVLVIVCPWIRPALYHTSLLESQTPVKAVDYIEQHALQGNIFHPQLFGDYLIWRLYPQQRSFIDGRVHLFGEEFVRESEVMIHDSLWQDKLASYKIRYLLLSKDGEQAGSRKMIDNARASNNWTVLFEDDVAILFERKGGVHARYPIGAFQADSSGAS